MFAEQKEMTRDGGFSLVELMIAMAIVAILAAVAMPAYFNHMMRSRQSAVIGELMSIRAAQERFFAENAAYAGQMNTPGFMYATSGTFTNGDYQYYFVTAGTSALVTTGTIRAEGDPNGDGNFSDIWELSIDNLNDKPKPPVGTVVDEGFSWSSLGRLFD